MDSGRTYLYAIIADEVEIDLGPIGLPTGTSPVTGLQSDGFTAVVGPYDGAPLGELSRADILRGLLTHQTVIERIMNDRSVLPVKFGTVLDSADAVRHVLSTFRGRLAQAFAEVADAVEIDLSATWDQSALFGEIREEPAIAALAGAGVSEAGLATRVEAGRLVHQAVEGRRDEYRQRAVETLRPLVRDMRRNPLPTEDMVLNLALLVERGRIPEIDRAIDDLASELDGRLNFRYVGPLPPYSFATVALTTLDPSQLASAVRMLGLEGQATRADVRAAYRRLAAEFHPDRSPGDPDAAGRFAALGAANRLLMRYLGGQRTGNASEDALTSYDLSPERAGDTLLFEIAEDVSSEGMHAEVRHESGIAAG